MKNIDIINIYAVFNYCKSIKEPFKGRVKFILDVNSNLEKIKPLAESIKSSTEYSDEFKQCLNGRSEVVRKHAKKDGNGEPIIVERQYNGVKVKEYDIIDIEALNKEIKKYEEENIVTFEAIKINDKEIQEMYETDISNEIEDFKKLDLSNVPDDFDSEAIDILLKFNLIKEEDVTK